MLELLQHIDFIHFDNTVTEFGVLVSLVTSAGSRLDNCTFHESVDLSNFEATRTLVVNPPEGEVCTVNSASYFIS